LKSVKQKLEVYRKAVEKGFWRKKAGKEDNKEVCNKINDGTHFTPKYVDYGKKFISVKEYEIIKLIFQIVNTNKENT
jgi:hypothetical protein